MNIIHSTALITTSSIEKREKEIHMSWQRHTLSEKQKVKIPNNCYKLKKTYLSIDMCLADVGEKIVCVIGNYFNNSADMHWRVGFGGCVSSGWWGEKSQ